MLSPTHSLHFLLHLSFSSVIFLTNLTYEYFQNSKDPIIVNVYRKFIQPERRHLPRNVKAGLSRLCTESKYTFFCSKETAVALLKDVPCKVIEIPVMSYSTSVSMMISKRSPYKKFLNRLWVYSSLIIIMLNYERRLFIYISHIKMSD